MLKSKLMVPGDRPLIAIGYKYNARKFLSFIVTENAGSTQEDLTYLSKYLGQFTNVTISLFLAPLSCLSYLGKLMRFTPTINQGIMIWRRRSSGLLCVVVYCYVGQLLR